MSFLSFINYQNWTIILSSTCLFYHLGAKRTPPEYSFHKSPIRAKLTHLREIQFSMTTYRKAGGGARQEPAQKSRRIIRGENIPFKEISPQFTTCKRERWTKGMCYTHELCNDGKENEVSQCCVTKISFGTTQIYSGFQLYHIIYLTSLSPGAAYL